MKHEPYEAYPFLSDDSADLRCDFEILTDEIAGMTALLAAKTEEDALKEELLWVCALIYDVNPSLRTFLSVTGEEADRLHARVNELREQCPVKGFVLPAGCENACLSHILRAKAKQLTRLLYRYIKQGHTVKKTLIKLCHLLSGYFFALALFYNKNAGVAEIPYKSRNYGIEE